MSMRTRLLALALLLTACGSGQAGVSAVPSPTVSADPAALVGFWTVHEDGVATGTLRLGGELTLFQDCGGLDATWKASVDGGFVAGPIGGDGSCFKDNAPLVPAWVHAAQGYRVDGEEWTLVDSDGKVLVALTRSGPPRIASNRSADYYGKEPTTADVRRNLAPEAAALPAGLTPVTYATLVGTRWEADKPGFLQFQQDGAFIGSDGCNGQNGRYALGPGGEVLAVTGPQTLIGCVGSPTGSWVAQAARAGRDGDELVLVDATGREIARMRASSS